MARNMHALPYPLPEGYFVGKPGASSSLFVLQAAISIYCLVKYEIALELEDREGGEEGPFPAFVSQRNPDGTPDNDIRALLAVADLTAPCLTASKTGTVGKLLPRRILDGVGTELKRPKY